MKDFIQLLKLPSSIISSVSLGTGLILFLPEYILDKLGLNDIPDTWRTILGITFIVSTSIIAIYIIIILFKSFGNKIYFVRFKLKFPKMMESLMIEEKKIATLLFRPEN